MDFGIVDLNGLPIVHLKWLPCIPSVAPISTLLLLGMVRSRYETCTLLRTILPNSRPFPPSLRPRYMEVTPTRAWLL